MDISYREASNLQAAFLETFADGVEAENTWLTLSEWVTRPGCYQLYGELYGNRVGASYKDESKELQKIVKLGPDEVKKRMELMEKKNDT